MAEQKKKKLKKKADKKNGTKIIPLTGKGKNEEGIDEDDEDSGGIYLEKEDVKIIYNALKEYKPTQKERQRFELLVESFEEMLVIDYGVKLPGFEDMNEEDE
jgi:hypothetical protein